MTGPDPNAAYDDSWGCSLHLPFAEARRSGRMVCVQCGTYSSARTCEACTRIAAVVAPMQEKLAWADRAEAVLRRLELQLDRRGVEICSDCQRERWEGHADDCELAALLAEAEEARR